MKISVICVYNNNQFESQLCRSLSKQEAEYELIGIDNTCNRFSSAAKALNYGASIADGEILIFSHQDIFFKTKNELGDLARAISHCKIGDIVGTQGVIDKSREYYTNLTSGNRLDMTIINNYQMQLYEVSCVDEGLFGMKKATWENHCFDEVNCDNWHLYCVEACLNARKCGGKIYVYPAQIHHFSKGTISKLHEKFKKIM